MTRQLQQPGGTITDLEQYRAVQDIARQVLALLPQTISEDDTELSIARKARHLLAEHGIHETWYYDCPAFVLLGSRSCLSISGRDYRPSEERVGRQNLITVDLSPSRNGIWGDCSRSFYVEEGQCKTQPLLPEFIIGARLESALHDQLRSFASPNTTCAELFTFANRYIALHGFENLDFLGNVGHSIERDRSRRQYIESGNNRRLGDIGLFTFEPHIKAVGGRWGFKHENIYYFDNNTLQEL